MTAYREVKLFDLSDAPDFVRDPILPMALAHASPVEATSIWEVTIGSYDWQDAAEEWALHRWLRESGGVEGEHVLVKMDTG